MSSRNLFESVPMARVMRFAKDARTNLRRWLAQRLLFVLSSAIRAHIN
jgi:hypothetical protein